MPAITRPLGLVLGLLVLPLVARAQTTDARPEDVASIDAVIAAAYDAISGPAGDRDWDRFRTLFVDDARLIPIERDADGAPHARVYTVEGYIERASAYFAENAFYEVGIDNTTEHYGPLAHTFSTYESRRTPDGEPFARGINSFQLLHDGERWWIVTIYWQAETPSLPIPERYLPDGEPR